VVGETELRDLWPLLLLAVPLIGVIALMCVMNRWGAKHDPMGGTSRDLWSLKSREQRGEWRED